jgi:peptidoglycan/xylan/chitin deacetylase (PgdA/CDA1 family)
MGDVMHRLGILGLIAAALAAPANAQSCPAPARTITVAPGQHLGGWGPGFKAAPLGPREVILTFDDGPEPETTPKILDILRKACVPATFFVLGGAAKDHPALMKRELAEGHAVGGHTVSHDDLTEMSFAKATKEITDGFAPVTAAGGQATLFRFPRLFSNEELLDWLSDHGMAAINVDIDPWDWAGDPPAETLERFRKQLNEKGRGIILLHDSQPNTVKLLPDLLDLLRREGYSVVRLVPAPARKLASH